MYFQFFARKNSSRIKDLTFFKAVIKKYLKIYYSTEDLEKAFCFDFYKQISSQKSSYMHDDLDKSLSKK